MPWWFITIMIALVATGVLIGIWVFLPTLKEREEAHTQSLEGQHKQISTVRYFLRGFFVRLAYGSMAIPFFALLLLIKIYLLDQPALEAGVDDPRVRMVLIGSLFYLVICVIGGFVDAARKPPVPTLTRLFDVRLAWQQTSRRTKIGTFLIMVWSAYMFLIGS